MFGPGGEAHSAAQQVQFNLTEKGIDFLGYKTLKSLLGSVGKSSFGAHDTPYLATGVEAEGVSEEQGADRRAGLSASGLSAGTFRGPPGSSGRQS